MSRKLKEKVDALLAVERGAVYKAQGTDIEIALVYPNTYHVGMSNLGLHQIKLITNNPRKIVGIEGYGLKVVERVPIEIQPRDANVKYLRTKKQKLGHILKKV